MNTGVLLGSLPLRSPLVAASGTFGSVAEFAGVTDLSAYGAAVAKSVSAEPWTGRPAPRLAPAGTGMLNGIGIQNPGIDGWLAAMDVAALAHKVPVWGSAVGHSVEEFGAVAKPMGRSGVAAIEVNLSCPNLDGDMFALSASASAAAVAAVVDRVGVPVGAKLSPNSENIARVAAACREAGATFVTLTNTVWGAGIDIDAGTPLITGVIGGYSGPPIKPIALRCVIEVARTEPDLPIVGCGGVSSGRDVIEFMMAGASAVALGTVHFAKPRAARRILREVERWCRRHRVGDLGSLTGRAIR